MTGSYADTDRIAALTLNQTARVGIVGFRTLMRHFGSGEAILRANETELQQAPGIGPVTARKIIEARTKLNAEAEAELAEQQGAQIIPFWSDQYPALLKQIYDPPLVLYAKGAMSNWQAPTVALVGSRNSSVYGRTQAQRLAEHLSVRGITVVSGLARGIDTAAHVGTLDAGGQTVAVLGSGLGNLYPPENAKLAERIAQSGAVMSEYSMGQRGAAWTFPRRNRIISGMSLGTVVVEAGERSGALISARTAIEQGREVFAVPGKVDNPQSRGCHRLIRDGAKLVENVDDILEELTALRALLDETIAPIQSESPSTQADQGNRLSKNEQTVYKLLSSEPMALETIVERSGLPAGAVAGVLTVLEIERLVKALPGKEYTTR